MVSCTIYCCSGSSNTITFRTPITFRLPSPLQSTFELSLLASGSTIELVDQLIAGSAQNGMAIIRPPGHHAMKAEFNGYCFFNNVALAAQHALDVHKLQRILIIDYDVHHGQGTQRFFYNDPRQVNTWLGT